MANSVRDILEVLLPSYRSIDLRALIVTLGDGNGWKNIFTVIRFSEKTVEEIQSIHVNLKTLYELPREFTDMLLGTKSPLAPYKGINIELSAYPVADFGNLTGRLTEGLIDCSTRAFRVFRESDSVNIMQGETEQWDYLEHEGIEGHWPVYYYGRGSQTTYIEGLPDEHGGKLFLQNSDLDRQSRSIGRKSFQELVEGITERSFSRNSGHAFQLFLPIYARIDTIILSSDTIKVSGTFDQSLGDLIVESSLSEGRSDTRGRLLGRQTVLPQKNVPGLSFFLVSFQSKAISENSLARISLLKQTEVRVDLHSERSSSKSVVPVIAAFTCFVPEEDITEYIECLISGMNLQNSGIYKKFIPKDRTKKNEELLEYVVNYLLALCRLNPILLSNPQYDVLNGGLQAGSADIVASTQGGIPILVSCTMGMPDVKKRDMLAAARTAIASRIKAPEDTIRLLLVTGKPTVSAQRTDMSEIAATNLRQLWLMCRTGDFSEARQILGF